MAKVKVFEKWVKLQGQGQRSNILVPIERSCHKEHTYEIPITCQSKDMANVKVFEKWVKLQSQSHYGKNYGTIRKFLS
jgi:ABC-type molybdate transport system substrate-binding protein